MNWLEITSMVGCQNLCSYCPQSTFIKAYLGKQPLKMDLKTFNKILDNVNKEVTQIHFSGFSEIFLHPYGHEFIYLACARGFKTVLFTTLSGFDVKKAEFLNNPEIILDWVRLHRYDGKSYDALSFNTKRDLFTNNVRCNRFEDMGINLTSRAGNLWEVDKYLGAVDCQRIDCNVVLPDGTLVLCCSDWGMTQVLGNLINTHYDSDSLKINREKVRAMGKDPNSDIICRKCEMAVKL